MYKILIYPHTPFTVHHMRNTIHKILNDTSSFMLQGDIDQKNVFLVLSNRELTEEESKKLFLSPAIRKVITEEQDAQTLADGEYLNELKHKLHDILIMLDQSKKVYAETQETKEIKHKIGIILHELKVHGLLPHYIDISKGE